MQKRETVTPRSFFGIAATSMVEERTAPSGETFLRVCEPVRPEFESTLRRCMRYAETFERRYGGASYRVGLFRSGRPVRKVIINGVEHTPESASEAMLWLAVAFGHKAHVEVVTD